MISSKDYMNFNENQDLKIRIFKFYPKNIK